MSRYHAYGLCRVPAMPLLGVSSFGLIWRDAHDAPRQKATTNQWCRCNCPRRPEVLRALRMQRGCWRGGSRRWSRASDKGRDATTARHGSSCEMSWYVNGTSRRRHLPVPTRDTPRRRCPQCAQGCIDQREEQVTCRRQVVARACRGPGVVRTRQLEYPQLLVLGCP